MNAAVLITGASGFLGRAFVDAFLAAGWPVAGAGRVRPPDFPAQAQWRSYDVESPELPRDLLDGIGVVVHGALVRGGARDFDVNASGGVLLADRTLARGSRFVFVSSLAAHESARSQYGRHKYVVQNYAAARGALAIRPGLVVGNAGSFAAMCRHLRRRAVVPLVRGGMQPIQTVYVNDLARALVRSVEEGATGVLTAADVEPVAYRRFYEDLARRLQVRAAFVPVPAGIALAATGLAAAAGVRLPIDREHVLGLLAMKADEGPRLPDLPARGYSENLRLALDDLGYA